MSNRTLIAASAFVLALAAAGCSETPSGPASPAAVGTLEIAGPSNVPPGRQAPFQAIFVGGGSRAEVTREVQWHIPNPAAAVDAAGVVTGLEPGEAVVSARYRSLTAEKPIFIMEDGTYRLSGRVLDGTFPLRDARIVVSRGTGSGRETVSNFVGDFKLYGVAGDVELTVTHPDYQPASRSLAVSPDTTVDIVLKPLRPPSPLTGTWTLSMQPSPGCSALPRDIWPRTYPAALMQTESEIKLALTSDTCSGGCTVILLGRLTGAAIDIDFPSDVVDGALLTERLSNGALLMFSGKASGAVSSDAIEGPFRGEISYSVGNLTCTAQDHSLRLTRR